MARVRQKVIATAIPEANPRPKGPLMTPAAWKDAIDTRQARVGIIGMGYVGLPLARTFCGAGFCAMGFDVDAVKVEKLNAGKSYIKHIPSSDVMKLVKQGLFRASDDPAVLRKCHAIIICVPTPLTSSRDPDMRFVESTAHLIADHLQRGQLIVLESTTYPGTTRDLVLPILETSGLKVEKDFFLAYSPEREDPGRVDFTTETIPKVVGGFGKASSRVANQLYGAAVAATVPVSNCEVAEAAKILENVYRSVNIALINELKVLFDKLDIDVFEVVRAASTKPFGFQPFYPGPGLGGHCIPIDPFYLTWKARQHGMSTRFIELAGEINTAMPEYVVSKVSEALNRSKKALNGSKILVLGLAYKKDVDDIRESPSIELIEMLKERGAKVDYNDPFVAKTPRQREHNLRMTSKKLTAPMIGSYDCVLIATDHTSYDYGWIVKNAQCVVDTRNATAQVKTGRRKIVKA
ncbi:MAG: nucleotide sugar dehydrogenase [Planctomycetota bacterium]